MNLLAVGLNHRTAPLDLREKLTVDNEQLAPSLNQLSGSVQQNIIISTCNRLEIYSYSGDQDQSYERIVDFLRSKSDLTQTDFNNHLYRLQGKDCAEHLFRVSAGLDSMIIGERQVLGQVRNAFSVATSEGHSKGPLSRLFHQALRVGRRVHRETEISKHSRSVSQAAVELARGIWGDLSKSKILVIGAGDAGQLVAKALYDAGVRRATVTNRTQWRAEQLAQELGGVTAPFEELPNQVSEADVIISASGSPGYLLDKDMIGNAVKNRINRPLLIVDIAVPRDVDPTIEDLAGVNLYDIDSLQSICETDELTLEQSIHTANSIVIEETNRFSAWWDQLDALPIITNIRQNADHIRREETSKTLGYIAKGHTESEKEQLAYRLDALTSAIIKKLLHQPTAYLRNLKDPSELESVKKMFNLGETPHTNTNHGTKHVPGEDQDHHD